MAPSALDWVQAGVESLHRALLGALLGWELEEQPDPLRWVLLLRFREPVRADWLPPTRELLRVWAEANHCSCGRSEQKGRDLRVLIYLRQLRPSSNVNPYERKE